MARKTIATFQKLKENNENKLVIYTNKVNLRDMRTVRWISWFFRILTGKPWSVVIGQYIYHDMLANGFCAFCVHLFIISIIWGIDSDLKSAVMEYCNTSGSFIKAFIMAILCFSPPDIYLTCWLITLYTLKCLAKVFILYKKWS